MVRYARRVARSQSVARSAKFATVIEEEGLAVWSRGRAGGGSPVIYLEVGNDLWAVRHVNAFENGNTLC